MSGQYNIKAHPTEYRHILFRSRLEARWARFFDLVNWDWKYEPIDFDGWTPDFYVVIPCGHSDCLGDHSLFVEVKPYFDLKQFDGHPCMDFMFGGHEDHKGVIPCDSSAAFGIDPSVSHFEIAHGAGGGCFNVPFWVRAWEEIWNVAGNYVQWKPDKNKKPFPSKLELEMEKMKANGESELSILHFAMNFNRNKKQ